MALGRTQESLNLTEVLPVASILARCIDQAPVVQRVDG